MGSRVSVDQWLGNGPVFCLVDCVGTALGLFWPHSRGRTLRQFILGVLIIPFTFIWSDLHFRQCCTRFLPRGRCGERGVPQHCGGDPGVRLLPPSPAVSRSDFRCRPRLAHRPAVLRDLGRLRFAGHGEDDLRSGREFRYRYRRSSLAAHRVGGDHRCTDAGHAPRRVYTLQSATVLIGLPFFRDVPADVQHLEGPQCGSLAGFATVVTAGALSDPPVPRSRDWRGEADSNGG